MADGSWCWPLLKKSIPSPYNVQWVLGCLGVLRQVHTIAVLVKESKYYEALESTWGYLGAYWNYCIAYTPSPSLSKRANASRNSAVCSSVSWSAILILWLIVSVKSVIMMMSLEKVYNDDNASVTQKHTQTQNTPGEVSENALIISLREHILCTLSEHSR